MLIRTSHFIFYFHKLNFWKKYYFYFLSNSNLMNIIFMLFLRWISVIPILPFTIVVRQREIDGELLLAIEAGNRMWTTGNFSFHQSEPSLVWFGPIKRVETDRMWLGTRRDKTSDFDVWRVIYDLFGSQLGNHSGTGAFPIFKGVQNYNFL